MTTTSKPNPQFPAHSYPRTWLLTSAASPIGIALARALLSHGESVVLGVAGDDLEHCSWTSAGKGIVHGNYKGANGLGARGAEPPTERAEEFGNFLSEVREEEGWEERVRVVGLDGRCESLPSGLRWGERSCWGGLVSKMELRREGQHDVS